MAQSIDWSLKKVFVGEELDLSTHAGEFMEKKILKFYQRIWH